MQATYTRESGKAANSMALEFTKRQTEVYIKAIIKTTRSTASELTNIPTETNFLESSRRTRGKVMVSMCLKMDQFTQVAGRIIDTMALPNTFTLTAEYSKADILTAIGMELER